jgi:peptidoglycan/xylan/chitin deacetylase (PgdA/CDA1 family)
MCSSDSTDLVTPIQKPRKRDADEPRLTALQGSCARRNTLPSNLWCAYNPDLGAMFAGAVAQSTSSARQTVPRSLGLRVALAGRTVLQRTDEWLAWAAPKDQPGLLIFVFHCVFKDEAEADSGLIDPHERATSDGLARLFSYFRDHRYRFVSADESNRGLPVDGRFAHLTFDDGFANNFRLIDLLAREQAYATIFPSAHHIQNGKAFWWNVVYRERQRRGQQATVAAEYAQLRQTTDTEIDRYLVETFGPKALEPAGDIDRPLTVSELRDLASSPWIEIGNHTLDHAVLSHYPPTEVKEQIAGAQRWLTDVLGEAPFFIAYPNGDVNDTVVDIALDQGLRLGVTVAPARNKLPLSDTTRMRLGRFRIVFDRQERARMHAVRSSVQLAALARSLMLGRG